MAENLPVNFPIPGETAIATYNYTEIADATGVVIFDGFATQASGALISYALSANPCDADPTALLVVNSASQALINFDVTFNTPKTVKGNTFVNFTLGETDDGGACHAIITLYKGTEGTFTSLGTATCSELVGTISENNYYRKSLKIPVTETHFKKGDILRASALFSVRYTSGNHTSYLFFNPADATLTSTGGTAYHSTFKLYVPFKLDL